MLHRALLLLLTLAAVGCSRAAATNAAPRRYGDAMVELGHRFEVAGRAAAAGRFELAKFEVGEIDEIVDEDLPRAAPPKVGGNVDLAGLTKAFAQTNLKELDRAAEARDKAAFAAAYKRAADACNGCHAATSHGFIEIAPDLGAGVPRLDAATAPSAKP